MRHFAGVLSIMILIASLGSGCAYTRIRRPFDMDFQDTSLGTKEGKSHTYTILYLFAWGDAGTKAAAEDGDIKVIKHADVEYFSIFFGVYTRITTVLYGD